MSTSEPLQKEQNEQKDDGTSNGTSSSPQLDIPKLHSLPSEQQDFYLFNFTSDLVQYVRELDKESISAQQKHLKKEVFQIIALSSPVPTRAIRSNLGRCLAQVFGEGDRRLLFESINELVGVVSGGKGEKELKAKHAAIHCLGDVFAAAGDSAISLSSLACLSLLKQLKYSQNHSGLRGSVFKTLGQIVEGVGASIDEVVARDVWKQARTTAAGDKSAWTQINACKCLEQLIRNTSNFDNSNDFDSLKSTIWKAIDSTTPAVRHAAASTLAAILVKSYSEETVQEIAVRLKKSKRASKRQSAAVDVADDMERPGSRPGSPALKKPALRLAFNVREMLRQLSTQYLRVSTTNRARAGIATCYAKLLKGLDQGLVEKQYGKIANHFFNDLLSNLSLIYNRYRLLTVRKYTRIILQDVVGKFILGESGQLAASRWLINDILKNYPQVIKERAEPSKHSLTSALECLSSFIQSLGSATGELADSCREALVQVLQHPNYTVQIHASHCLQVFVLACPQQLLPCISICMNSLNRELKLISGPRHSSSKCLGFAHGLAATLSTSRLRPLYGSIELYSRVFSLATELLKSSSQSELRMSSTQVQVAWTLIGGLMPLGPNFVKIHISQLLLLWKNALPKPLHKENGAHQGLIETSFLTHVRECALSSILTFLEYNSRLLTTDVSNRIAAFLQNTISFLDSFSVPKGPEDVSQRLFPSLTLSDLSVMARRRVLQCYNTLAKRSPIGNSDMLLHSNLLSLAVSLFADPENYSGGSLSANIAASAGNFEGIWDVGDNSGFGVTGLIKGPDIELLSARRIKQGSKSSQGRGEEEFAIDKSLLSPICGAREHDLVSLFMIDDSDKGRLPDPPATEVVNSAIRLFAMALPLQAPKVQESILEQITTFLSSQVLQKEAMRKNAMSINVGTAMMAALQVATKETESASGDLKNPATERITQELLRTLVMHHDPYIRNIGAEALGRLCDCAGNAFTAGEINYMIDSIVANRNPGIRAGCALALGCIHTQVGGMAAGYHLKTITSILMSLCSDPHPIVHFWALEALARVAESAGLTYSGYVSGTLGMLAQLYMAESHNEETSSQVSSNLETIDSTTARIGHCVDSLINVLGPDLQDMVKARDLIFTLVRNFCLGQDVTTKVEGLKCLENLSLYAPGTMHFAQYVQELRDSLTTSSSEVREVAINSLHNLLKRNAQEIFEIAGPTLEDQLWTILDEIPEHEGIKNLLQEWLRQTALSETHIWVQRCQRVLSKAKPKPAEPENPEKAPNSALPDLQDEEVAGFAAAANISKDDDPESIKSSQELLKWQVRRFAMGCLSELLFIVEQEMASNPESKAELTLQQKVGDVIRMAFAASTANVVELRILGLRVIDQVLKMFGRTPDPDFTDASLLEQYQAQISSALTPAFSSDSSAELATEAINVCASFVSAGIVTDADRMGRILKLLVTSLENLSTGSESAKIGDFQAPSTNAQVMVKMAVFSAWAELQVTSLDHSYLDVIAKPHLAILTPLWLESLQEFARLRFEPDISSSLGSDTNSQDLNDTYASLNRQTLLKFYQSSWLKLVNAIASLIEQDSDFVFDALDGNLESSPKDVMPDKNDRINYREEPVAFFFVLFGITFEALAGQSGTEANATRESPYDLLQVMKKILRPSVSGNAIYQDATFSETTDLLERLAMTEGPGTQGIIVDIARNLCLDHPSVKGSHDRENLSEDVEQLFELTRIIVIILAGLEPELSGAHSLARPRDSNEAVSLIRQSLDSLVDVAEVFPSIIKTDLHACILHIFIGAFGSATGQGDLVPAALPTFRRFIQGMATSITASTQPIIARQLLGCLKRLLSILAKAQLRESDASLPCAKNILLASTILLTTAGFAMPPNHPLVIKLLEEMLDCLQDIGLAKVAASCIRSLLLAESRTAGEAGLSHYLLPRLLLFLLDTEEDPEGVRVLVAHALSSFAANLPKSHTPVAFSLIAPALLARAARYGSTIFEETAVRLLELAGADPVAFRGLVGQMSTEQKGFMEGVIKSVGGRKKDEDEETMGQEKPTIALKMDF
ncbi:MAG: hypothetical protein M1834_000360 [Cirrosporium novae-zelandiae]|nr:MAG: hypothetical protein M1834_000360 [Cirrosporium novae-zelandiae]